MKKYVIISKNSIDELEMRVNEMICQRYVPIGGVVVLEDHISVAFLQTMVELPHRSDKHLTDMPA